MKEQLKEIEIPFGAKDSELCGWEYTIPEGMEATIVDNKIVVKKKESEDEQHRKWILEYLYDGLRKSDEQFFDHFKSAIAWLEKQGENEEINEASYRIGIKRVLDNPESYGLEKQGEQKPAWSEEDEKILEDIKFNFEYNKEKMTDALIAQYNRFFDKIKSLKQEWSEEDKKLIDDTCHLINTLASGYGEKVTEPITFSGTQMIASIKDRLRALVDNRPQSQWKPSKEQMKLLREVQQALLGKDCHNRFVNFMYELKRLREE